MRGKMLLIISVIISFLFLFPGSCIGGKTEQFITEKTNGFEVRNKANFILNSSNIIVEGLDDFLKGTFEKLTLTDHNYLALKQRIIDNSWQNITNQLSYPSSRYLCSMTYDSFTSKGLLFGGSDYLSDRLGDTWIYDYPTNTWTQISPITSPSARDQFAMVYNTNLKNIILFGGRDDSNSLVGDTWIYDMSANTWTDVTPSTSPSPRYRHEMAYDSNVNQVVFFGGSDEGGKLGDTWVFDPLANTWTQKSPTTSPSIRESHAMVYHSESAKVVLYGGQYGGFLNDTWVYDLATNIWTNMNPSPSPGERAGHTLAYDSTSNKVILFGGGDNNDTWMYNILTNTWQLIETVNRPTTRYQHSLFYDSPSNRIILFGGYKDLSYIYNDTWIYPSNKYYKNGTFTSRIYSLTNINRVAGVLSWNPSSQPVNTNLKIQMGFSNTTKEEDFSYTTYSASNFTFSSIAKYLRYRVRFESNMFQLATPFLKNVQLEYSISIPTFPNAPKNLVASINNHLVELSWTSPSDNGGSSIIRYNIYRGTLSGNYLFLGVTSNTNYIDSSTLLGVTYYYVVTARNSIGESLFSNEVSVTQTFSEITETIITTTAKASGIRGFFVLFIMFTPFLVLIRKYKKR